MVLRISAQRLDFQSGQALQTHIEDRLRLNLGQAKVLHQPLTRFLGVLGGADELDDRVKIIHRDHQALQDMLSGLRLLELVLCAAGDDVLLVRNIAADQPQQRQLHGLAVRNGDHVHAESDLQVGHAVEMRQHLLRIDVAFELDHRAHTGAVGFVADVGNA